MRFYLAVMVLVLVASAGTAAQTLYKYRGENGEWIYADRPPEGGSAAEVRDLGPGNVATEFRVTHAVVGRVLEVRALNPWHVPVELALDFEQVSGVQLPHPDDKMRWVVPALADQLLLNLEFLEEVDVPAVKYSYLYLPGDPTAQHAADAAYRVPYAVGSGHRVTQAYPEVITHTSPDSYYAVDIEMPVGTDIFAARGGVVFSVASTNFSGGADIEEYGDKANVVRILHDDGTYGIYAHLNRSSIRVRPGDVVERGDYIADSGNTGFSSGPHLHFAVVRNGGMKIESVPVSFSGPGSTAIDPSRGAILTAY